MSRVSHIWIRILRFLPRNIFRDSVEIIAVQYSNIYTIQYTLYIQYYLNVYTIKENNELNKFKENCLRNIICLFLYLYSHSTKNQQKNNFLFTPKMKYNLYFLQNSLPSTQH
jgi:hypothetical protein